MWAICTNVYKKRLVEPRIKPKGKWVEFTPSRNYKHHKVAKKKIKRQIKRKIFHDLPNHSKRLKSKSYHCLVHEEQHICDIYECSGVHSHQPFHFMAYIN